MPAAFSAKLHILSFCSCVNLVLNLFFIMGMAIEAPGISWKPMSCSCWSFSWVGHKAKRHYHLRRRPGNHPVEFLWCIAFALTLSLLLLRSWVPPQPPPSFLLFSSSAMGFWLKCMHILEICMHFIFTKLCYQVSLNLLLFLLSCVTISGTLFSVLYVL